MTKNVYYMHLPLWVQGYHMDEDLPVPQVVIFDHKDYKVTRVISLGEKPPENAALPLRKYVVEFSGVKKTLYYNVKQKQWYSLKRISEEKARAIRNARGQGFPEAYFRSVIEKRSYLSTAGGQ